jgi:hypothetical protein
MLNIQDVEELHAESRSGTVIDVLQLLKNLSLVWMTNKTIVQNAVKTCLAE